VTATPFYQRQSKALVESDSVRDAQVRPHPENRIEGPGSAGRMLVQLFRGVKDAETS
jgi:hypothetical protein